MGKIVVDALVEATAFTLARLGLVLGGIAGIAVLSVIVYIIVDSILDSSS